MIATVDRGSREPLPQSSPQAPGAPEFAVQFSRPSTSSSRPDLRSNTFRWTGPGSIHILERGLLVVTRRRSPLGLRTADERFVPASEICEVYREGDSVRVDLRGDNGRGAFFQFWTGNPAAAGTIVRLLPTTRTIEYEGAAAEHVPFQVAQSSRRRRVLRRRMLPVALTVGLLGVTALLVTDITLRRTHAGADRAAPGATPNRTVPAPHATPAEVTSALVQLRLFDDRIDGLRAQYRMAFEALQSGHLSQDAFVAEINRWLIPQWRILYGQLAFDVHDDGSVTSRVLGQLMRAAAGWDRGLEDYAEGLQTNSYSSVMAAFDRMSDGNEARREAWRMMDRAELESSGSSPRTPSPAR